MQRIKWIDVAKAIGIFAIYVGHISTTEGVRCVPFVWTFHVALFFLISGCAEAISSKETGFGQFLVKKIKTLFIPWLTFALVSIAIHFLKTGYSGAELIKGVKQMALGCIRNNFVPSAGAIWFLTCLFVIQILFFFIKKLKNKWLILGVAAVIHIVALLLFDVNAPKMPYNLDTAMYYILYYATGYISFEVVNLVLNAKTLKGKILLVVSGVLSFGYCGIRILGKDIFGFLYSVPYLSKLISVISTLIIIYAVILLAKILENVELFQKIGQNTIYLCAGEYVTHTILYYTLALIGIFIKVQSTFYGIVLAVILLAISYKFVTPLLKETTKWVQNIPDYFVSKQSKEKGSISATKEHISNARKFTDNVAK